MSPVIPRSRPNCDFYERLVAAGKLKKSAMIACVHKLISLSAP
jgi:hypothetical protein